MTHDDAQIECSRRFGEPAKSQGHIADNFSVKPVCEISNAGLHGRLTTAGDPRILHRTAVAGEGPAVAV